MKREASKSDRNPLFVGPFYISSILGIQFRKPDSFLAAVELYRAGLDSRKLMRLLESAVKQLQLC